MKREEPISFSIGMANYFSNVEHTPTIYSLVAGVVWHWRTPHINTPQNTAITHKTLIRHKIWAHSGRHGGERQLSQGSIFNKEVAIKRLLGWGARPPKVTQASNKNGRKFKPLKGKIWISGYGRPEIRIVTIR